MSRDRLDITTDVGLFLFGCLIVFSFFRAVIR